MFFFFLIVICNLWRRHKAERLIVDTNMLHVHGYNLRRLHFTPLHCIFEKEKSKNWRKKEKRKKNEDVLHRLRFQFWHVLTTMNFIYCPRERQCKDFIVTRTAWSWFSNEGMFYNRPKIESLVKLSWAYQSSSKYEIISRWIFDVTHFSNYSISNTKLCD